MSKERKEELYKLLQKLDLGDRTNIVSFLSPETRDFLDKRSLDETYEHELKRVDFKFHDEYDCLWDLRDYRGFLDESPQHYNVLGRIVSQMYEISFEMDEGELKQELSDLALTLNFFTGDA